MFLLPLIIGAIEEESRLCFVENEGPVGLIIAPSRELAYQIYRFAKDFISKIEGLPQIRLALCTGGVDMQKQLNSLNQGVHIVISTPGRLSDMLGKQKLDLKLCKILILDEADRLLDQGFDEEVRAVLSHTSNVQIVLSSSTIPKRMQEFGTNFMKNPVFVSCHKYSLKKLKISQFCDLVNIEGKMIKLLDVLQRTDPLVLIFCENKNESDSIFEFLRKKKIECASLHGGKVQTLRSKAIEDFVQGNIDVLIATDVAAKGLSFDNVKHIVNYDMPKDIDAYIQRICRAGKKAIVSNFLTYKTDKSLLGDLTDFMSDMNEQIPEFLLELGGNISERCEYCNIKGHRRSGCNQLLYDCLKSELPLNIL